MKKEYLFILLAFGIILNACKKDDFYTGSDAMLRFSSDTLTFDTVFTEVGSATRFIKVYNDLDQELKFDVRLNDESHFFRINANGESGTDIRDITIRAHDSIYIFAEVTIDPDQPVSISPFVINRTLEFTTNDNLQSVVLEAWGQNANYIPADRKFNQNKISICQGLSQVTWDDPKPYVIYGIAFVDICELVIPAGAEIYVHGGYFKDDDGNYINLGIILVSQNGKLSINGTLENPVVITGDRLEEAYENRQGQWSGIILLSNSKNNNIHHTTIKNSIVGIRVDSLAELNMDHSIVANTSGSGILAIHSKTNISNCLFYNNAINGLQLAFGGEHHYDYCTIVNDANDESAVSITNYLCYDPPFCEEVKVYPSDVNFTNCIITGSNKDELSIIDVTDGQVGFMDFYFDHCILRVDELLSENNYPNFFENSNACQYYETMDNLFVGDEDYHLDTLSIAEKMARPLLSKTDDLDGSLRDLITPDIGCYERID